MKPGIELVMEANENYWRKVPSVKRIVFQSVPEATTRLAILEARRSRRRLPAGRPARRVDQGRQEPRLVFSGGIATNFLDFFDMWDPKSPWPTSACARRRAWRSTGKSLSDADTLGASKPNGNVVLRSMEYSLPIEPDPYDPAQAKKLLAEAGYPNGFDGGDLYPIPPYFATGEAIVNYLGAIGIKTRLRTMERAAFYSALARRS